jgi:hypothetical protein
MKKGISETLTPGGKKVHPGWLVLQGLGLASGVQQAAKKDDPTGAGRSRLHRTLQLAGDQVGGVIGTPFGFSGGMTGSLVGGAIGSAAGRLADRVRGYKGKHLPASQQTMTQVGPIAVPKVE